MRRRLNYANVTATLALFFAMSGGALAAKHYLINSTKQINPKVLKALKGKTGATGRTGTQGLQGLQGPQGPGGPPGASGALAGYSASESGEAVLGSAAQVVTIPGLSKSLPPGSFIASAILNVQADGATATEEAGIDCELEDKQSGGAAASQEGLWSSLTNIPSEVEGFFALGSIPIQLGVTSGLPNTLSVNCSATSSGPGLKQRVTSGSLTAVQTTGNR